MSKIDYQALREVAEKATPGNWWIDSHGQAMVSFINNEVLEVFVTDNKRDAVRHEDTGNLSRWRNDNDATFIATANPATVLALLDELEAKDRRNAELNSTLERWATGRAQSASELDDAEKRIDILRQDKDKIIDMSTERISKLLARAEAAENRIAELEAREVVPDEMTPKQASRSYCGEVRGYRDGWNACRAAMLKSFGNSEQLDEVGSWNNHLNTPTAQTGNHTEQNLDMVDHFGDATKKAMLHGSEPVTDNTNQQFESLSRGDK